MLQDHPFNFGSKNLPTSSINTLFGWQRSCRDKVCLDQNERPIPWYNYSLIYFLKTKINKEMSVLEFGGGFSTLFYAMNCKNVITIESNEDCIRWINCASENLCINNIKCIKVDKNTFHLYDIGNETFDIIAIDGSERINCLSKSVNLLNKDGFIIFDNSDFSRYKDDLERVRQDLGLYRIDFIGHRPCSESISQSTVLFYTLSRHYNSVDLR